MFFQLLYIHLFRPFLKYNPNNSPLPSHVSPRKHCTQAAAMIAKLLRLYKRSHGLRQICNICVYITHSACTIHLLNLPEKNAKRDITHGIKHLEEIAEGWLCARRTLGILSVLAKRWKVELPEEAAAVLSRTELKFGPWSEVSTPKPMSPMPLPARQSQSPTNMASPSLQPYAISVANVPAPQYVNRVASVGNASMGMDGSARAFDMQSMPPSDPNILARPPHHRSYSTPQTATPLNPVTPASSGARLSVDGQSTTGNSPSHLFGDVNQLMREGQDWIWRDQTQLASGFGNWNPQNIEDISSWFASNITPPTKNPPAATYPIMNGDLTGGPVGGNTSDVYADVSGYFGANSTGLANMSGNLQGFTYDEGSWYEYQ